MLRLARAFSFLQHKIALGGNSAVRHGIQQSNLIQAAVTIPAVTASQAKLNATCQARQSVHDDLNTYSLIYASASGSV